LDLLAASAEYLFQRESLKSHSVDVDNW
jgi:hypothetical protein